MNPKPPSCTVLFSNPNGGIDVVDEASLVAHYEVESNPVATVGRKGESSKVIKEASVEDESTRIVEDLVKVLASPPLREAVKNHPIFSNLLKDGQSKGKAFDEDVKSVSKDKDPRALTNKEKDALYKARKSFKNLGINLEKGKDLNQVQSQLEFVKAILANKEEVERLINTYEMPKAKLKTLEKKSSPNMFSIPCSLGDYEVEDAFCDSGSFVSVISSQMASEMELEGMQPCTGHLTFGDQSVKQPKGVFKNFPIRVGDCIVPTDLLVVDMVDGKRQALLLGIPFMETAGAKLDYVNRVVSFEHVDKEVFYPLDKKMDLVGTIFKESPIFTVNGTNEDVESEPQGDTHPATKKKTRRKRKAKPKKEVVDQITVQDAPQPPIASSITLKPMKIVDGKLECKVKSSNGVKPFAKAKIVLGSVNQDEVGGMLSEKMAKIFGIKLEDRGPKTPPNFVACIFH